MFCPLSVDWGNVAQWVSGGCTFLAIVYALYRDNIQQRFQRPIFRFLDISKVNQNGVMYYRLIIKNDSRFVAKNVEFEVNDVVDSGNPRDGFLPASHSWTHRDLVRDISPYQVAYLNLCSVDNAVPLTANLTAPHLETYVKDMALINSNTDAILLKFYTENGYHGEVKIKVECVENEVVLSLL